MQPCTRALASMACFVVLIAGTASAQLIIEETFTGYLDNVLISASPAGPAMGLVGDWSLSPNSDFYVNKTQVDEDAGTGQAVYDRPSDDNGARTAVRDASAEHVLFTNGGDVFYASFVIEPGLATGRMTFELELETLDGAGGAPDFSFGVIDGAYITGNGGVDINASGGTATADRQRVVVRLVYGDATTGATDDEVVTVWSDPASESDTPVVDGVAVDFLNRGGGKITSIRLRGDSMSGRPAFFDDLLVGHTFADVTPDPVPATSHGGLCLAAVLVLGLGVGLVRRRPRTAS